jgi:hypothetical protein
MSSLNLLLLDDCAVARLQVLLAMLKLGNG